MPPAPSDVRARFETDLPDQTIQATLDDAVQEIETRFGPYRDPDNPISVTLSGARRILSLPRPLDETQPVEIVEHWLTGGLDVEWPEWDETVELGEWWWEDSPPVDDVDTPTTLADDDYRVWNGGRTLERLFTGTNPRIKWGMRADITYVPVDDTPRRDEVVTKLAILALQYQGVIEQKVGDVTNTYGMRSSASGGSPLVYAEERERLLSSIQPRHGLTLR